MNIYQKLIKENDSIVFTFKSNPLEPVCAEVVAISNDKLAYLETTSADPIHYTRIISLDEIDKLFCDFDTENDEQFQHYENRKAFWNDVLWHEFSEAEQFMDF